MPKTASEELRPAAHGGRAKYVGAIAAWCVLLCAATIVTRWPAMPRYLFSFDSVNFALALEHFDARLHQPQPPGYPLFVAEARLIHLSLAARNARSQSASL